MASLLAVLAYDPETSFEVLNIRINTDYSCNDIHNKLVVIKHSIEPTVQPTVIPTHKRTLTTVGISSLDLWHIQSTCLVFGIIQTNF